MEIVDIHTHAFPDELAERSIPFLEEEGQIQAYLDGKVSSLLQCMDRAGITRSVVASIATKPSQFDSILRWSTAIASDRILPFPSIHPEDSSAADHIRQVRRNGLLGIKLHPYYQDFVLDDSRMETIYAKANEEGLILLMHTGYDLAYARTKIANPERVLKVLRRFPGLKMITTHCGAWQDWEAVLQHMLGREIFMDTSYSIPYMSSDQIRRILEEHPKDYLLFGSDSPWGNQSEDLCSLCTLIEDKEKLSAILGGNALRLLELV